MAGRGETVKYIIDADTSGFNREMVGSAIVAEAANKRIERSLNRTSKQTENNFTDIRRNAATAASQIRNFGVAFQAFNTTSWIIGITAATGAILELSGAVAAAGSTLSILEPLMVQGGAAALAFQSGVFGLAGAFKAVKKNDAKAFAESMVNLGPAARSTALAVAGLNKAFNSIRLNTQQALLADVGDELLRLGASILPTVNAGFQNIGRSMNGVFKQAANLAEQPLFSRLLATIFADTAHNIDILSGALSPLLSIFTNLYLVSRSYVSLLAEQAVNLLKNGAAYLNTTRGQEALNIAIQTGLVAIKEIGNLAGAVFGLLTSIFRTSVNSGVSLITTLTHMAQSMEAWVNSAEGQEQLIALFKFTSLVVQTVGNAIGQALTAFFGIVKVVSSLNPQIQQLIVGFLASSLVIRPVVSYLGQLYLAFRVLAVALFNFGEQALVVFGALGAASSVVLVLAVGLIALGAVLKGPLGTALIFVGALVAAYIGLNFLLARVAQSGAASFWQQAFAAHAAAGAEAELAGIQGVLASTTVAVAGAGFSAGAGLTFAARAAQVLQASIIPLLVAAAGLIIILSMLGLFSNKGKQAEGASTNLGGSLTALQKSMRDVGNTGKKTVNKGLTPLSDQLNSVGDAANAAQGQLASFDKMNVLTSNTAIGAGAGIPNVPGLPDFGGADALGAPPLNTTEFDKSLAEMQKNFEGLKKELDAGITNPFAEIGDWINAHPWVGLVGFGAILTVIIAIFAVFGAAAVAAAIGVGATIGLIVAAIAAVIAIIILLVKNWDKVWETNKKIASIAASFIGGVFKSMSDYIAGVLFGIGKFFADTYNGIVAVFTPMPGFFADTFTRAINAVKGAFGGINGYFQGVWNGIVGIFSSVGVAVGNAIGGALKSVVNGVINNVSSVVNTVIDIINGAISVVKSIPGFGKIGTVGRVALPRLAKGGIVTQSTIANIGENGAEAVMPLENNTEWIDKLAAKINNSNGSNSGDMHIPSRLEEKQPAQNITIEVSGVFATSVAEQRRIADIIAKRISESTGYKTRGAF